MLPTDSVDGLSDRLPVRVVDERRDVPPGAALGREVVVAVLVLVVEGAALGRRDRLPHHLEDRREESSGPNEQVRGNCQSVLLNLI